MEMGPVYLYGIVDHSPTDWQSKGIPDRVRELKELNWLDITLACCKMVNKDNYILFKLAGRL